MLAGSWLPKGEQANANCLKNFLFAARLAHKGSDTDTLPLSTLLPIQARDVERPKKKLTIHSQKEYPLTSGFPCSLEQLEISYCKLSRVDTRWLSLQCLRRLDLSNNYIKKLPAALGDLACLAELILTSNHLEAFPAALCHSGLQHTLQYLDLSQNNLVSLPAHFYKLRELVHLKLDSNQLWQLPPRLGQLTKLQSFSATHNQLPFLPSDFLHLKLQNLDLFGNPFNKKNPFEYTMHLTFPLTLLEVTSRAVVNNRIPYGPQLIPAHLCEDLELAKRCDCGKACVGSFIETAVTMNMHLVSHTVVLVDDMAGTEAPVQRYFCSLTCYSWFLDCCLQRGLRRSSLARRYVIRPGLGVRNGRAWVSRGRAAVVKNAGPRPQPRSSSAFSEGLLLLDLLCTASVLKPLAMRFRIYKRKVFILTLVVLACAFAVWSSGRQKKSEMPTKEADPVRSSRIQATGGPKRRHNETQLERPAKPDINNMTLVYRGIVFQLNFDQPIRNKEKFNMRQKDEPVVVVQVHNRPEYLKLLVESLRQARGIENILLIFSHDYWSPEVNQIVASVDFCQVLQIFFPFSIQLYPHEFPGNDPKDCPRDIAKEDALKLGCINAEYPDSFGHYREAKFSQTKHHWWWKLHFVWERVKALKDHNGVLLLIEEDHVLSPDFYHVLKMMESLKREQCPECDILSLGAYSHAGYSSKANKVEVKAWKSTEHNMGMAMYKETYEKLIQCTEVFCTYDDYNWDWSLQYLTVTCLPVFWKVMVSEAPRIFHAGDCGMHHKKACMPSSQKAKIEGILQGSSSQLFPKTLVLTKRLPAGGVSPHVKNGGWGDIRDHELCKSYRRLQ
ncbi:alpha-1,6-mannosyl-glycoprotein 2-beta-N-acetylglucosaminyltransferase [Arapaima gigas]